MIISIKTRRTNVLGYDARLGGTALFYASRKSAPMNSVEMPVNSDFRQV
jgi:hypothetical protein